MTSNDIVLIIFGIILIFVAKKVVNIYKTKKMLEGDVTVLKVRGRSFLLFSSVALVIFGTVYAFMIKDITSIIYIFIGIGYAIVSAENLHIGENGFCYDGKFIEFKKIKKWTLIANKFFELTVAGNMKEETITIPLSAKTADELSTIIKMRKTSKTKGKK